MVVKMSTELILWVSIAFYVIFMLVRQWRGIAVFDILAIAPLIMVLITLGDEALPLSVGVGVLILVHIWSYWNGVND